MKVYAIICEFNPFHNGHRYLIEQVKKRSDCDAVVCLMSGNFTQRGDIAIQDKFTRARHAISSGADIVLENPTPFAVAPAEIFASGAVKILSSLSGNVTLAFGTETATKEQLFKNAFFLEKESDEFKQTLSSAMQQGQSYAEAYQKALETLGGESNQMKFPNDILALEYTKAMVRGHYDMDILPIPRIGAGYHDTDLHENFSSATAIRHNLGKDSLSDSVPSYVLSDLPEENYITQTFEEWTRLALIDHSAEQLSHVFGCTEGLENKLKNLATLPYDKIIESATTKRYSSTRIRRILCANLLKLDANQTKSFLEHLYIRPLAVDKGNADRLLSYLGEAKLPVVIKERERQKLSQTALECLDINDYADLIYGAITKTTKTSYTMLKV